MSKLPKPANTLEIWRQLSCTALAPTACVTPESAHSSIWQHLARPAKLPRGMRLRPLKLTLAVLSLCLLQVRLRLICICYHSQRLCRPRKAAQTLSRYLRPSHRQTALQSDCWCMQQAAVGSLDTGEPGLCAQRHLAAHLALYRLTAQRLQGSMASAHPGHPPAQHLQPHRQQPLAQVSCSSASLCIHLQRQTRCTVRLAAFLAGPVQAPAGAASPGVHTESLTPVQQEQGDYYDYDLPAKQSWPELVGTNAQQAQGIIAKSPGIKSVQLVQVGQAVTDDYVTTRVRVYYAPSTDKVAQTPKIG